MRTGMSLRNRVALITGGTRGIGKGIALRLAKEGASIAIGYRSNKNVAQNTLRQLQTAGASCVREKADIKTSDRSEQFVKTETDQCGLRETLVNRAFGFSL